MVRIGRPKIENPKNIRLEIRLTKDEAIELQYYAEQLNTNRTGVLMQGLRLIGIRKEVRHMNAEEARKKSEMGAIKNIENLIEREAEKGFRSLDLNSFDVAESFNEAVQNYFEDQGFEVRGMVIFW